MWSKEEENVVLCFLMLVDVSCGISCFLTALSYEIGKHCNLVISAKVSQISPTMNGNTFLVYSATGLNLISIWPVLRHEFRTESLILICQILREKYRYCRKIDNSTIQATDCIICMAPVDLTQRSSDRMVLLLWLIPRLERAILWFECYLHSIGDALWALLPYW